MERIEKINALRRSMELKGLDAYIIPASDPHQSEHIPACWQFRKWVSGFTGSAGTIVITRSHAGLWTDSRYFLQAEKELGGSGIELFRLRIPHTPEHIPWLLSELGVGSKVGMDDRFFSASMVEYIQNELSGAGIELITSIDLIASIWTDCPALPLDPVVRHGERFVGVSRADKITQVRKSMKDQGADYHLITTLDDIAWLFNLRGGDISYCPFFISYCVIDKAETHLFIAPEKIPDDIRFELEPEHIVLHDYQSITDYIHEIPIGSKILYSPDRVNYALVQSIPGEVIHHHGMNITTGLKAIKNSVEIKGLQRVMVKDGAAWVKTLYWIFKQLSTGQVVTEWSVANRIAGFRSTMPDYQGESFHPISSYNWHGAVVHYSVTPEESINLEPSGIFLLDSGGHFSDGTTDTTRTIALSSPDDQQKSDFTRALKGTLAISMLRFPKGTKGFQMDILARKSLWDIGLNYGHGTGHGVGFFLSVHEGPQTIGTSASGYQNISLEPGMVTTIEPAIYREGQYGMRTENMTLVVEDLVNEFGEFYKFETLTLVPIDKRLTDKDLLTADEIHWIDSYHYRVYQMLAEYLDPEEQTWLQEATSPL
jgi:Xaa-Pro aminopeptidase